MSFVADMRILRMEIIMTNCNGVNNIALEKLHKESVDNEVQ